MGYINLKERMKTNYICAGIISMLLVTPVTASNFDFLLKDYMTDTPTTETSPSEPDISYSSNDTYSSEIDDISSEDNTYVFEETEAYEDLYGRKDNESVQFTIEKSSEYPSYTDTSP